MGGKAGDSPSGNDHPRRERLLDWLGLLAILGLLALCVWVVIASSVHR